MNQLQELFEGFRDIYSPNTPKQVARKCIDKGQFIRIKSGQYEWAYENYRLFFWANGTRYEVELRSDIEEQILLTMYGDEWESGDHPDDDIIPICDWDNIEVEIFLRERLK